MHAFKESNNTSLHPPPITKQNKSAPFDSDDDLDTKKALTSHEHHSSSTYSLSYAQRNKYKNEFRDSGGLENQSVQELESYAVYKSEETTKTTNNCLRIAEEIRGDATKTLVTLHHQGEQITRIHMTVTDIDRGLTRGEKHLGSLGGMFSKTWKPKSRKLTGPLITRDDPKSRKANHLEQKEKLGLVSTPNRQPKSQTPPPEPTNALQRVEYEKVKQDEALSHLSSLLEEIKGMAIDMGTELDRGNDALKPLDDDVDKMVFGVEDANRRGQRLLRK